MLIGAMLATRHGEFGKADDLWKQVADAVPTDWRVQNGRGAQLYGAERYADAIDALNKAVSINPNAGPAYNMIDMLIWSRAKPPQRSMR